MDIIEQIVLAKRRAVTLIGIETTDQLALVRRLGAQEPCTMYSDVVQGIRLVNTNPSGELLLSELDTTIQADGQYDGDEKFQGAEGLVLLLSKVAAMPGIADGLLCIMNAQYALREGAVSQALCLLRDVLQKRQFSVVLLAPALNLPAELTQDVLVIEESLPSNEQLQALVRSAVEDVGRKYPKLKEITPEEEQRKIAGALQGLALFPAEQALRLALPSQDKLAEGVGIDTQSIVQRKQSFVKQCKGLTLATPSERMDSLAGLGEGKKFLSRLMNGPEPPLAVLFMDEIDKSMGGSASLDTSGVSKGYLGTMLSFTSEWEVLGLLLYGIPGTGKTALAKSFCGEYGLPFLNMDLRGMEESLVGSSEANLRAAIKVSKSLSAKRRLLLIATCNTIGGLPPELEDRFTLGSFFFDYPTSEALADAWGIWARAFNLPAQDYPACDKWTGRDVRKACELAYRFNAPINDVLASVVPASIRDGKALEEIRKQAHGRFLDVDRPGVFDAGSMTTRSASSLGGGFETDLSQTSVVNAAGQQPNIFAFTPGMGGGGSEQPVTPKEKIGFDL